MSTPLPPLHGRWLRATRAPGRLLHGEPRLEDGALVRRGVTPAAALAFLLSAPAINPIVLTATAIAFPNNPEMVVARGGASLIVADTLVHT